MQIIKKCTPVARRLCNSNVDMIKKKWRATELTWLVPGRIVVENLIKTGKIGVDMYLPFVNESLIKEKLSFLTQLKGLILT